MGNVNYRNIFLFQNTILLLLETVSCLLVFFFYCAYLVQIGVFLGNFYCHEGCAMFDVYEKSCFCNIEVELPSIFEICLGFLVVDFGAIFHKYVRF